MKYRLASVDCIMLQMKKRIQTMYFDGTNSYVKHILTIIYSYQKKCKMINNFITRRLVR